MNLAEARLNMIQQQCRTWEVYDEKILDLLQRVPREDFVPAVWQAMAFADMAVPLPHGQAMLTPKEEARILAAVAVQPHERVWEIGTGSGYLTALLACQAQQVQSVDIFADFTEAAAGKLAAHGIHNVVLHTADALQDYYHAHYYDVMVITGSLPLLPDFYRQKLATGGRLLAILGEAPVMQAVLFTKISAQQFTQQVVFDTYVAPLVHAPAVEGFVF